MWRFSPSLTRPFLRAARSPLTRAPAVLCSLHRRGLASVLPRSSAATSSLNVASQPADLLSDSHQSSAAWAGDLPTVNSTNSQVSIGWDANTSSRYHYLWLRDHCRCSQCFHPVTMQRLVNTFEIPSDIKPAKALATPQGLEVYWSANLHVSLYPWSWLRRHSYDPPGVRDDSTKKKTLWGSKIRDSPPTIHYEEVMASDGAGVYKWLTNIETFGFSFVSGVPATPEATEDLANKIGFIRETQYGKFWDFTSDLAKGDTAYTTLALEAHTDNTYFTDPCGLQLFHLLSHTGGTGGATLLVDGFYVASRLREQHPAHYALLSTLPVPAHAAGEPSALYRAGAHPVLTHDPLSGAITQVRWNNGDRSVMHGFGAPAQVGAWYAAIKAWHALLTSPESEYWVQLGPGTAVVVNNHRVLHGRSAFDGKRRMCGAYIGIDEYYSRLAVLNEKFGSDLLARRMEDERNIWNPAL